MIVVVMTLSVRATDLINGKPGFSDHRRTKTPEPIDTKLDVGGYVVGRYPNAEFSAPIPTGGGAACA